MKYLPYLIALIYFINPYDLVPDFIVGPGWIDDFAVLGLAFWWASRLKKAYQARSTGSSSSSREQTTPPEEAAESDPYHILGVQPGASKEEIRAAYKKLAAQYHPDKVQHLGKEFQELAHKKFVAIQKAHDTLMK
ncbi:MAG: DnaJ domain-containing protein [Deltaproteobacteria bacterium]|nr:DnaJ domain-containing protein [Deltaproteobacteria bacterium]